MKCPLCETPVAEGDSFCEACGHPLTAPACASCGAAAVDAEGYCERCGVRQPTGRDHAETVLDDSGAAAVTDRGLRRARNEDAVALIPLVPAFPGNEATVPHLTPPVPVPYDATTIPHRPGTTPYTPDQTPHSAEDHPQAGSDVYSAGGRPQAGANPHHPDRTPRSAAGHLQAGAIPYLPDEGPHSAAGHSQAGPYHPNDTLRSAEGLGGVVAVVCDGVGSSPRADEAAAAAVAVAAGVLAEGRAHEEAFALAGRAVGELAASPEDAPACTYVAAVVRGGEVTVCWAGDSRAYWLADVPAPGGGVCREGTPLTEDDAAPTGEITAWLGADYPEVRPRVRVFTPPGPGLLLVCSDGLWRYLDGYRFPTAGTPLDQAREMLRHALDSGGHDNVTIALIPLGGTHG